MAPMTIPGAAQASGLTAHTLRYYERAGLLRCVRRAGSGAQLTQTRTCLTRIDHKIDLYRERAQTP